MTEQDLNTYEKVNAQLKGVYSEISALSKKSPSDLLNKFKLKFVNDILRTANTLLGESYKPFSEFEQFSDSDLPNNSDVAMILSQYIKCFEKFRIDNIKQKQFQWYWVIEGQISDHKTHQPQF